MLTYITLSFHTIQDITLQHLCSPAVVEIVEKCARLVVMKAVPTDTSYTYKHVILNQLYNLVPVQVLLYSGKVWEGNLSTLLFLNIQQKVWQINRSAER